jgi:hypothetical protein
MVRAVRLEVSGSGSYSNPSQGIFQSLDAVPGAPSVTLLQPTNNAFYYAPASISFEASVVELFSLSRVEFWAGEQKVGEALSPPYLFTWTNAPAGDYSMTARALCNNTLVPSSPVAVIVSNVPPPTLTATALAPGVFVIQGHGLPGFTYHLDFTEALAPSSWQNVGAATANPAGNFALTNRPPSLQGFYRSVYP